MATFKTYNTDKIDTKDTETLNSAKSWVQNNYYSTEETYNQTEIDAKIRTYAATFLGTYKYDYESEEDLANLIANPDDTKYTTWLANQITEEKSNNDTAILKVAIIEGEEAVYTLCFRYVYNGTLFVYEYTFNSDIDALVTQIAENTGNIATINTKIPDTATETNKMATASDIALCEKLANKTTSLTTASTDDQYPSAKATFAAIDEVYEDLNGRVETIENSDVMKSGITATKVNTYDGYATSKQDVSTLETDVAAKGFTKNTGTVTSVTVQMNGSTKGTITSSGTIDLGTVITAHQSLDACEKTANKVTSISSSSTDTQYPTAKCVYNLVGNVETILQTLNTGTGAK